MVFGCWLFVLSELRPSQVTGCGSAARFSDIVKFKLQLVRIVMNNLTERKSFVTATKLGTTNKFLVSATKNFAAAAKRFF